MLLSEESADFTRLREIIKRDRLEAKIFCFSRQSPYKTILRFTEDTEDPSYFCFYTATYVYAVNKNGKIYVKQRNTKSLIFKDKKAWWADDNGVKPAHISTILEPALGFAQNEKVGTFVKETIRSKIPYIRTFEQYPTLNSTLTYNYAVRKKVFSVKDRFTYALGGINAAKVIEAFDGDVEKAISSCQYLIHNRPRRSKRNPFQRFSDFLDDSSVNRELFEGQNWTLLYDSLKMAEVFGQTIKLSWSAKRFKAVHDEMAREITNRVLALDRVEYTIPEWVEKVAVAIDGCTNLKAQIFRNSVELGLHGQEMAHCVASYSGQCAAGRSFIIGVTDMTSGEQWTAQVSRSHEEKIDLLQFRGKRNCEPPKHIKEAVVSTIKGQNPQDSITPLTVERNNPYLGDLIIHADLGAPIMVGEPPF